MSQPAIKIDLKDLKPIEHHQAFKLLWLGSDICIAGESTNKSGF
ncbi:hypothetical protein QUA62_05805 [Microcoleus sp. MON1_C1]